MCVFLTFNIGNMELRRGPADDTGKDLVRTLAQIIEIIHVSYLAHCLAHTSSVGYSYYREAGWISCLSMWYNLVSDSYFKK